MEGNVENVDAVVPFEIQELIIVQVVHEYKGVPVVPQICKQWNDFYRSKRAEELRFDVTFGAPKGYPVVMSLLLVEWITRHAIWGLGCRINLPGSEAKPESVKIAMTLPSEMTSRDGDDWDLALVCKTPNDLLLDYFRKGMVWQEGNTGEFFFSKSSGITFLQRVMKKLIVPGKDIVLVVEEEKILIPNMMVEALIGKKIHETSSTAEYPINYESYQRMLAIPKNKREILEMFRK